MQDSKTAISVTATANSASVSLDVDISEAAIFVDITAVTGSSPTLDITPQISPDGGTTWFDALDESGSAITFAQFTGTGKKIKYLPIVGSAVRLKMTVGGSSPNFAGNWWLIGTKGK
jgi:hypothetical protein